MNDIRDIVETLENKKAEAMVKSDTRGDSKPAPASNK